MKEALPETRTPRPTDAAGADIAAVICACDPPPVWRETLTMLRRGPFLEVLVVDDGSALPLKIGETAGENAVPARVLRLAGNEGLSAARNHALREVDTPWVVFVDADVIPAAAWLAGLPAVLAGADGTVAGFGFHVYERHRDTPWDLYRGLERDIFEPPAGAPVEWISGLLTAYRTEALRAVSGFDLRLRTNGEDVDVGYRLTRIGHRLAMAPGPGGEHCRRDTLRSFLRMHWRYALTAKRVDRARYFPAVLEGTTPDRPPFFRWRGAFPHLTMMVRYALRRPWAAWLPVLVLGAKALGAWQGRRAATDTFSPSLGPLAPE